ncbi:hypothetical protein F4819DRAFT_178718 [Hypoxylon fuscum]|nr:hypothetical protein F4819DRAFT_178718 [Hypoxylon fuscum]
MDSSLQPERSAEMPIMVDSTVKLVKMLDEGASMYEIYREMVRCGRLDDQDRIRDHSMRHLLYSMSRKMLRSVLMNTLGPDLWNRDLYSKANWEEVLWMEGPGAYVGFMSVKGRKGSFLSVKEIRDLIGWIESYVVAVDASERNDDGFGGRFGSTQFPDDVLEAMNDAMQIDDVCLSTKRYDGEGTPLYGEFKPRFASSATKNKSSNIQDLIKMLKRRCLPGVDEDVFQKQSPLLVGNSGKMDKRAMDHLASSNLGASAKVWGLMISCLKLMGIDIEVQVAALFRAWVDDQQIDDAEVLGTVLAGSAVEVAGCNVKTPGTRGSRGGNAESDAAAFQKSKEHVFSGKCWYRDNLELSTKKRQAAREARHTSPTAVLEEAHREKMEALEKEKESALEKLRSANETRDETMAEALAQTEAEARKAKAFLGWMKAQNP